MALSLEAIYKPFNDFFIEKFVTHVGPVQFRLARLPRSLSDSDFILSGGPTGGASPTVAKEVFSFLVDRVMLLDDEQETVSQTPSNISDVYDEELLAPSMPFVPPDITDEAERQALMDAYSAVKAAALRDDQAWAESLIRGSGVKYHPATAEPAMWWDRTDKGVWTDQSFEIQGAAPTPTPFPHHRFDLLRMKQDDAELAAILADLGKPHAPRWKDSNVKFSRDRLAKIANTKFELDPVEVEPLEKGSPLGGQGLKAAAGIKLVDLPKATNWTHVDTAALPLHDRLIGAIDKEPVTTRFDIEAILADGALRQPVVTNDATISFSYCLVSIERSWIHEAFLRNLYWKVPGHTAGQLSANDGYGLHVLPVGFVAVKDLRIKASWTAQDIGNLEKSVQFGPFNFDSTVVDSAIGHPGIQVVGWMLQDMPALPPN